MAEESFEGEPYSIKKGLPLSAAGVNAALNSRAAKTVVDSLNSTVSSLSSTVASLDTAISSKASQADLDAISSTVNTTITSLETTKQDILPIGTILMFDGYGWVDNQTLVGWYACIAANSGRGCPNLVGSFIKGNDTASHSAGGNAGNQVTIGTNNLPTHTHSLGGSFATDSKGGHYHRASGWGGLKDSFVSGSSHKNAMKNDVSSTLATTSDGSHTHTVTLSGSTGNNATTAAKLNIEPQSYALIYIRKCV
jgi:hypothetical protein